MKTVLPPAPDFATMESAVDAARAERSELHALVGQLVFAWSNNESVFIYLLQLLLRADFEAAAITFATLNTTRARLDLVRRLAKARLAGAPTARRIEKLIERFNECTKVRNEFNHCIYQLDAGGRVTHTNVLRVSETKAGVRFVETKELTPARMREIAGAIRKLDRLNRDMWAFLPELERELGRTVPGRQ